MVISHIYHLRHLRNSEAYIRDYILPYATMPIIISQQFISLYLYTFVRTSQNQYDVIYPFQDDRRQADIMFY